MTSTFQTPTEITGLPSLAIVAAAGVSGLAIGRRMGIDELKAQYAHFERTAHKIIPDEFGCRQGSSSLFMRGGLSLTSALLVGLTDLALGYHERIIEDGTNIALISFLGMTFARHTTQALIDRPLTRGQLASIKEFEEKLYQSIVDEDHEAQQGLFESHTQTVLELARDGSTTAARELLQRRLRTMAQGTRYLGSKKMLEEDSKIKYAQLTPFEDFPYGIWTIIPQDEELISYSCTISPNIINEKGPLGKEKTRTKWDGSLEGLVDFAEKRGDRNVILLTPKESNLSTKRGMADFIYQTAARAKYGATVSP
jgi:hypothetical protein